MHILKQNRSSAFLLCIICLAYAALYNWVAIKIWLAHRDASTLEPASITRAISLEPADADYHDLLCRSLIFVSQAPQRAVSECQKAVAIDPYTSTSWQDLAQAQYLGGNRLQAMQSMQRALAVDPTTPDTIWSAANFALIQGDLPGAIKNFAVVLREQPSLAAPVTNTLWQSTHDLNRILNIVPHDSDSYLALLNTLLTAKEFDGAQRVWSLLMQLEPPVESSKVLFYVDTLLKEQRIEQAQQAWKQLTAHSPELHAYTEQGNLVTNGSFNQEILNSGFDWRYRPSQQVTLTLDEGDYHSPNRSLLLTYSDSGGDAGISQYIAVEPDRSYHLSVWVKSEELETANGPILTLSDAVSSTILASTEPTTGNTGWHRIEADVHTPEATHLLRLNVTRQPANTRIQGRFWIDDLTLTEKK